MNDAHEVALISGFHELAVGLGVLDHKLYDTLPSVLRPAFHIRNGDDPNVVTVKVSLGVLRLVQPMPIDADRHIAFATLNVIDHPGLRPLPLKNRRIRLQDNLPSTPSVSTATRRFKTQVKRFAVTIIATPLAPISDEVIHESVAVWGKTKNFAQVALVALGADMADDLLLGGAVSASEQVLGQHFKETSRGIWTVVSLRGEIGSDTGETIREKLVSLGRSGCNIIIEVQGDFRHGQILLTHLFGPYFSCKKRGSVLRIICRNPGFKRRMRAVSLDSYFAWHDEVKAATEVPVSREERQKNRPLTPFELSAAVERELQL